MITIILLLCIILNAFGLGVAYAIGNSSAAWWFLVGICGFSGAMLVWRY